MDISAPRCSICYEPLMPRSHMDEGFRHLICYSVFFVFLLLLLLFCVSLLCSSNQDQYSYCSVFIACIPFYRISYLHVGLTSFEIRMRLWGMRRR